MGKTWMKALLLTLGALGLAVSVAAQGPGEAVEGELRTLTEELFQSVADGDDVGVDRTTCLADLVHAQLAREEALGLIPDALAPDLVEERRQKVRDAVYTFVGKLRQQGHEIELTEASRIQLSTPGSEEDESVSGEGEEDLAITAAGVLGIKMLTSPRTVDIAVSRLQDRWCLDPLSMQ